MDSKGVDESQTSVSTDTTTTSSHITQDSSVRKRKAAEDLLKATQRDNHGIAQSATTLVTQDISTTSSLKRPRMSGTHNHASASSTTPTATATATTGTAAPSPSPSASQALAARLQALPPMLRPLNGSGQNFMYIESDLRLKDFVAHSNLSRHVENQIRDECRRRLYEICPLLGSITIIKLVANPRRNFINIRFPDCHNRIYYYHKYDDIIVAYSFSDKFEPYVIVSVLSANRERSDYNGRIISLNREDRKKVIASLKSYCSKHKLKGDIFYYTSEADRLSTHADQNVHAHRRSHSKSFHLKIKVPEAMMQNGVPLMQLFKAVDLGAAIEPVRYASSRNCISFEHLCKVLMEETQ
jgi:hypothetical protein